MAELAGRAANVATYHFCTYFDRHYLTRGLALYRSLKQHCPRFVLWVLCMDKASEDALASRGLPEVRLIALEDFERGDDELLLAKGNRKPIEYYFTCTPSLPLYVLEHWPEVSTITYLDADLYFFADPAPLFEEFAARADGSMAVVEHRFPPRLRAREQYGRFNVGWLSFRRDEHAQPACAGGGSGAWNGVTIGTKTGALRTKSIWTAGRSCSPAS